MNLVQYEPIFVQYPLPENVERSSQGEDFVPQGWEILSQISEYRTCVGASPAIGAGASTGEWVCLKAEHVLDEIT